MLDLPVAITKRPPNLGPGNGGRQQRWDLMERRSSSTGLWCRSEEGAITVGAWHRMGLRAYHRDAIQC